MQHTLSRSNRTRQEADTACSCVHMCTHCSHLLGCKTQHVSQKSAFSTAKSTVCSAVTKLTSTMVCTVTRYGVTALAILYSSDRMMPAMLQRQKPSALRCRERSCVDDCTDLTTSLCQSPLRLEDPVCSIPTVNNDKGCKISDFRGVPA